MKYHFAADLHTHTLASGHSYGTIRENVEGARAAGIQVLGATEHAPGIPGTVDPFYYRNIKVVPKRIHGVSILHGSEINVLEDGTLSLEAQFMKYLDYAIVGIHTVCYHDQGRRKNTDNVIACMQHPKVKIVSHPDDDHTPLDYERLVAAAKQYNVALEVNNSSFKSWTAGSIAWIITGRCSACAQRSGCRSLWTPMPTIRALSAGWIWQRPFSNRCGWTRN